MAGYVLKIMLEDTHPPVWRRIIIPEMITFAELHEIIQIIFGWSDDHLHDFSIPSKDIYIDNGEESWGRYHYAEDEVLVEQFLPENKWVRYTYDFGDEWRHKIIYEKTEESYEKRYASVLKVKGDNFMEDSGGVWGMDEDGSNRCGFEQSWVEQSLKKLIFPKHEDLAERMAKGISEVDLEQSLDEFFKKLHDEVKAYLKVNTETETGSSRMAKKIDSWKAFLECDIQETQRKETAPEEYQQLTLPFVQETPDEEKISETAGCVLEIVPGEKTNEELLQDLGMKEVGDYCKYLQIPYDASWKKTHMTGAIAQTFREHPEYLLYVLYEEEYKEVLQWMKLPYGVVGESPKDQDALIKALSLGLADVSVQNSKKGSRARLSFAKDVQDILKPLNADLRKRTYRDLKKFSEKLEAIVLFYGVVDFDSLLEMFHRIYHVTMDRNKFSRYVYWYARFNNLIKTAYFLDGESYVCAVQLDFESVLEDMKKYAADLDYVMFPAADLKKMTEDICDRNDWMSILFTTLHFGLGFSEKMTGWILEEMFSDILSGLSLAEVLEPILDLMPEDAELLEICELWTCIAGLMLELELPMLKGRSREQYAEERGISPWQTGMVKDAVNSGDSKECHMSEFPVEIQEAMYEACSYVNEQKMKMLVQYQTKEKIQSEEFLYLLAKALIRSREFGKGEKLLQKLEKSSERGKREAKILRQKLEDGMDVMDDEDDRDFYPWNLPEMYMEPVNQPYVRTAPKIGRNDPCPCGSGKKYKKCCGRNQ